MRERKFLKSFSEKSGPLTKNKLQVLKNFLSRFSEEVQNLKVVQEDNDEDVTVIIELAGLLMINIYVCPAFKPKSI